MVLKFIGNPSKLRAFITRCGAKGKWEMEPNGVHMLRCSTGVVVHWSETKNTLWVNGNRRRAKTLLKIIADELAAFIR